MTLSWQAVADDGGRDVTQYIVEKREPGKRSWTQVDMVEDKTCTARKLTVRHKVHSNYQTIFILSFCLHVCLSVGR